MAVPDEERRARRVREKPASRLLAIPAGAGLQLAAVPKGRSKHRQGTSLSLHRVQAESGATYPIVLGKAAADPLTPLREKLSQQLPALFGEHPT
jgi:hypothetical protein